MDQFDFAMLLIRVWLGIVMIMHGTNHARSLEGTAKWFAKVGFKSADLNARVSAFGEIAIGLSLAFGLLTSLGVTGLVATMFVAFWSIHRFVGFFIFRRPDEGYEYVVTVMVAGVALAMLGPGSLSLDAVIGVDDALDGWVGAGIATSGLLVGYVQTLIFWRKPKKDGENDE